MWLSLAVIAGSLIGQAANTQEEFTAEAIETAITQLAAGQFQVREDASSFLWRAGDTAREALDTALQSDDPEVVRRAKELLEKLNLGIRPNSSPEEVALLRRYQAADEPGREEILRELRGKKSFDVFLRLLRSDLSKSFRERLMQEIISERGALAGMLVDDPQYVFDQLMPLAVASPYDQPTYGIYLALTGNPEAKITALSEATSATDRLMLAHLLRLTGNVSRALEVVRQIPYEDNTQEPNQSCRRLEAELLRQTGDWAAMANLVDHAKISGVGNPMIASLDNGGKPTDVERLGYSAFFHRLAGDQQAFEMRVADLKALAERQPDDVSSCVTALLTNERYDEAVQILPTKSRSQGFELLVAQLKFRAALELVGLPDKEGLVVEWYDRQASQEEPQKSDQHSEILHLTPSVATLLVRLGRVEDADRLFDHAFEQASGRVYYTNQIIFRERCLRRAAWTDHAVKALDSWGAADPEFQKQLFYNLVGDSSDTWWRILRELFPGDDCRATLQRMDALDAGNWRHSRWRLVPANPNIDMLQGTSWNPRPFSDEQRALVKRAIGISETLADEVKQPRFNAIAELCFRRKEETLARHCYEQIVAMHPTDTDWIRLGDLAADDHRWEDAAKAYHQAWRLSKKPLPLYLHGVMLSKLGRNEEAEAAKKLARLLPFAEESERAYLAQGLFERQLTDEAKAEWDLILNSGTDEDWGFSDALVKTATAKGKKRLLEALPLWERYRSVVLSGSSYFVETDDFLEVAREIHRMRAYAFVGQGQREAATTEALLAIGSEPDKVDVAIDLIADFEAAGEQVIAEAIFSNQRETYMRLCEEFPQSSFFHNALAWLTVKTHHSLDDALIHAAKAVELAPDDPASNDTLALVHHARRDRDLAIRYARRTLELVPSDLDAQKQLAELEQATP